MVKKPKGIGSAKRAAKNAAGGGFMSPGMMLLVAALGVGLFLVLGSGSGNEGAAASSSSSSSSSSSAAATPKTAAAAAAAAAQDPPKNVGVGGGKYYGGACPKTKHYLMYDVGPGERFNMRKAIVMRPVNTAKALMKKLAELSGGADTDSVTLVLPPFKQFGDELYERWGRFFDVAAMGAGIGVQVCEQDQYFNSVKAEIDLVFLPGQKCPAEAMARRGFEQEVFGVATKIGQLFCEGEQEGMGGTSCTSPALVDKLAAALEGATLERPKAVMIPSMESVQPNHESGNAARLLVQQHTRFGAAVVAAAREWVRTSELGGRKYVAMHLRRGDFMRAHAAHAPSLDDVAKSVRDAASAVGVADFVLATNGSPKEVEELRAKLQEGDDGHKVALHRFGKAYENENVSERQYDAQSGATGEHSSLQVAAIEQFLTSEGEVFFGTHLSTFSMQIHHERRAAGKDWDATSRTVLPGPKLAKMCVYGDRDADKAKAATFVGGIDYGEIETCEYW